MNATKLIFMLSIAIIYIIDTIICKVGLEEHTPQHIPYLYMLGDTNKATVSEIIICLNRFTGNVLNLKRVIGQFVSRSFISVITGLYSHRASESIKGFPNLPCDFDQSGLTLKLFLMMVLANQV